MLKPTVHLNGTSREELLRQLEEAASGVRAAITALGKAHPNGRDYYPQGRDVIVAAVAEWRARVEKIDSVLKEIEEIYQHVEEQGRPRNL